MRSTWTWFTIGLLVLGPLQIWFVANDSWFCLPPKPVGDGPDYENIGFHLAHGRGWSMGWTDPQWREPYVLVNNRLPQLNGAEGGLVPMSYEVQLGLQGELAATTARPPLLPALIALEYCLLPRNAFAFAAIRVFLASCLAIAGAMAAAMSARLIGTWTERTWPVAVAATFTIALAALDRTARSYATDYLTEPLALLLVQSWILCVAEVLQIDRYRQTTEASLGKYQIRLSILGGLLLAMLIFTRSLIVLWLPGVWLLLALASRFRALRKSQRTLNHCTQESRTQDLCPQGLCPWQPGWRLASYMLLTCVLVCSPWWIRNCLVLEAWMPLGTQGPITLVGGYSDDAVLANGEWQIAPEIRLRQRVPTTGIKLRDEVAVAREASRTVIAWIQMHQTLLPALAWARLRNEWNPFTGRALIWKMLALIGLVFLTKSMPRAAWLLGGVIAINSFTVVLLYSVGGRFLVPTYGILYTLAGIGMAAPICFLVKTQQLDRSCRV